MTARQLDPVLLEILRHRLDAINDDAAATLTRVSGSQIAVEANDMNTAILTADGRVVSCGKFVLVLVVSLHHVVEDILEHYGDNPGIRPGDQFLTNDPYVGTIHQPDVVVVAPVFIDGELVAWTGSCVHHADVGGPVPGGINYEAHSIFDEAVPIKPIKLIEAGTMRRDVEREFLSRSRRPDLMSLDLLGQVSANRATVDRLLDVAGRYGAGTLVDAMERILDGTAARLRSLLVTLPDGRWRHVVHLEHEGRGDDGAIVANQVYAIRLTMTKRGAGLVLDFRESDDQALGAINASYAALTNFALAAVMIHLCAEIPWTAGAVNDVVTILSRPGSIAHATWPAGVAMSTASSGQAIRACVNACIARLLDASDDLQRMVMAGCQFAGGGGGVISGVDADGLPFGTMTLDELSGGGGARTFADGADTSGFTTSPGGACANVEVNESYYPILYEGRWELADSGGPGERRGGVGLEVRYRPHRTSSPITVLSFGQGLQHPQAPGVVGGQPGSQSGFAIVPVAAGSGSLPARLPLPTGGMQIAVGELFVGASQGGGGWGDPLDRPPDAIAVDVANGLVSVDGARRDHGVVIDDDGAVDASATDELRMAVRRQRLNGAEPRQPVGSPPIGRRISSAFVAVPVTSEHEAEMVVCRRCTAELVQTGAPLTPALVCHEVPVGVRGGFGGRYAGSERFVVRHLYCPGCGCQVDVQIGRLDEPLLEAIDTGPMDVAPLDATDEEIM